MDPSKGLSLDQRSILGALLNWYRWAEGVGLEWWRIIHGMPWRPGRVHTGYNWGWSPSDRATTSRALARLEKRGLVVRTNVTTGCGPEGIARTDTTQAPPPKRTDHVILTPLGRQVAEGLT